MVRFLLSLGIPDGLLGDLLEQRAHRSTLWLWKQVAGAVVFAAMRRSTSTTLSVPAVFVGVLTWLRFDRVWVFAIVGAASFWTFGASAVIDRRPPSLEVLFGISLLLGLALYRVGSDARGERAR